MTKHPHSTMSSSPARRSPALPLVPLALVLAVGGTGCYRATGETRPTVVSEQIPATGGDRVTGNKATAGPGDYYLGNDNVHLAVDGAVFGDRPGQFDAPSGGAILDIGGIGLDQSYKRVPLPTDNVERLAPVVNQDPDLPLVFENYAVSSSSDTAALTMKGHVLDPKRKLAGATWDASGRVLGLEVEHTITLRNRERSFDLLTTIRNTGSTALPVRNIADYLHQSGGGFRFLVPAVTDFYGNPLSTWGVEIPGSDFTNPLSNSVQAPSVALMGAEPSALTYDLHQSLGILPLDQTPVVNAEKHLVLVASDPQHALTEDRPKFPARLVVGSLPAASLDKGGSLVYHRRVYQESGSSLASQRPAQATGLFNTMASDLIRAGQETAGVVGYTTDGSSILRGPRQTELRFERYTGSADDPSGDADPTHWYLERVEWREAGENVDPYPLAPTGALLPVLSDAAHPGQNQPYRLLVQNRTQTGTGYSFLNATVSQITGTYVGLRPSTTSLFQIANYLSPERAQVTPDSGAGTRLFYQHGFDVVLAASSVAGVTNAYQPLRITLAGLDANGAMDASKDPDHARLRTMADTFNVFIKGKVPTGFNHGAYQFTAGNQIFGSSFVRGDIAGAPYYLSPGAYAALGTRGPLSVLDTLRVDVKDGIKETGHTFLVFFPNPMPAGWTSFDLPGPSQITTGGMLPGEQLSSALAEGVQVVGRTELDRHSDASALVSEFLSEFDTSVAGRRQAIDGQLFTFNARTSVMGGETATALFTPAPIDSQAGGARSSKGWTLADFTAQAEGKYTVLHHPKGHETDFATVDAIELLRGEGCDPANPSAWFADFKTVRAQWFDALNHQASTAFTKGLGLSSGVFSLDTPVGLARTYLKMDPSKLTQADLSTVLAALKSGAAVASTGPLLDVNLNGTTGPGSLLVGPASSVTLNIDLWAPDWVPVQEVRVVVNGVVVQTLDPSTFTVSPAHSRLRSTTLTLDLAALAGGKDAWVVVEAGVLLATSGAYAPNTPWSKVMKGIYPVAVANPIFVDVNGGGYTPPL